MLRLSRWIVLCGILGQVGGLHGFIIGETKLWEAEDSRVTIDFQSSAEVEVEWQFSNDSGLVWRPVGERLGTVYREASPFAFYTGRAGIIFPGELPTGMSLRAKFEINGEAPRLSPAITVPHRHEFPRLDHIVLPESETSGFSVMTAGSGFIVASYYNFADRHYDLVTLFQNDEGEWIPAPVLSAPEGLDAGRFGRYTKVSGDQLFVSTTSNINSDSANVVFVYEWMGPAVGWSKRQELSPADALDDSGDPPSGLPQLPAQGGFGSDILLSDELLLISEGGLSQFSKNGSVFVYRRDDLGNWNFDGRLFPVSSNGETWKDASQRPVVIGDTIVTYGQAGDDFLDTFFFDYSEGEWIYRGGRKSMASGGSGFALGEWWCQVESDFSEVHNGVGGENSTHITVFELAPEGDDGVVVSEGFFDYGFFPVLGTDDWLIFAFEPSANYFLLQGAVALTPLYAGTLHPNPALLIPPASEDYDFIGASFALDGNLLYVASSMVDDSKVIDVLDLSQIPHPAYPQVAFPVWMEYLRVEGDPSKMMLKYRASADLAIDTQVEYLDLDGNWTPYPTTPSNTVVLDPDPDGDGRTILMQTVVPVAENEDVLLYRVAERLRSAG